MKKVLLVDDSSVFRKVLKATLERAGYEVITAENGSEAIRILGEENSPELVLLDRVMPDMDGLEVCKWVRSHVNAEQGARYKYFIVLTSKTDQDDVLEGFAQGADDYVMKPFCNQELLARIAVGMRVLKMQRELWETAIRDMLTGLYNRRAIYDLLAAELARARRDKSLVGVALIDVDRFKQVNDNYGHSAGDEVLSFLAQILKASLPEYDLIGRLGGEEFIIAFSCTNDEEAVSKCESLRKIVADQSLHYLNENFELTVSIGLTTTSGEVLPAEAINWADKALYQAKKSGRNCVVLNAGESNWQKESELKGKVVQSFEYEKHPI